MIPDLRALPLDLAGRGTCEHCDKPVQLMGLPDEWWHDDGYVGCDHHDYGTFATPKPLTAAQVVTALLAAGESVEDIATAAGMVQRRCINGRVGFEPCAFCNGHGFVWALPSSEPTKGDG